MSANKFFDVLKKRMFPDAPGGGSIAGTIAPGGTIKTYYMTKDGTRIDFNSDEEELKRRTQSIRAVIEDMEWDVLMEHLNGHENALEQLEELFSDAPNNSELSKDIISTMTWIVEIERLIMERVENE